MYRRQAHCSTLLSNNASVFWSLKNDSVNLQSDIETIYAIAQVPASDALIGVKSDCTRSREISLECMNQRWYFDLILMDFTVLLFLNLRRIAET